MVLSFERPKMKSKSDKLRKIEKEKKGKKRNLVWRPINWGIITSPYFIDLVFSSLFIWGVFLFPNFFLPKFPFLFDLKGLTEVYPFSSSIFFSPFVFEFLDSLHDLHLSVNPNNLLLRVSISFLHPAVSSPLNSPCFILDFISLFRNLVDVSAFRGQFWSFSWLTGSVWS